VAEGVDIRRGEARQAVDSRWEWQVKKQA
jgi:hypothetical protein